MDPRREISGARCCGAEPLAGRFQQSRQHLEHDFWLVNDTHVIPMHYDEHGRFRSAELFPDAYLDTYRCTLTWGGRPRNRSRCGWARHPDVHQHHAS